MRRAPTSGRLRYGGRCWCSDPKVARQKSSGMEDCFEVFRLLQKVEEGLLSFFAEREKIRKTRRMCSGCMTWKSFWRSNRERATKDFAIHYCIAIMISMK